VNKLRRVSCFAAAVAAVVAVALGATGTDAPQSAPVLATDPGWQHSTALSATAASTLAADNDPGWQ